MIAKMYEQMMDSRRLARSNPVEQGIEQNQTEESNENIEEVIQESSEVYNQEWEGSG